MRTSFILIIIFVEIFNMAVVRNFEVMLVRTNAELLCLVFCNFGQCHIFVSY
jgi:hypothetical protein